MSGSLKYFGCAATLLIALGVFIDAEFVKAFGMGMLLICFCLALASKIYDNKLMIALSVFSVAAHFFLIIVFNVAFNGFGADSLEYHNNAAELVLAVRTGSQLPAVPGLKQYFTGFIAVIYLIIGVSRISATFVVSFFTALAGMIMYLACRKSGLNKFVGHCSSLGVWFMPGFLIFTSDILKDSLLLFMTALAFYLFALIIYEKMPNNKRILVIIALMAVVFLDSVLRFYVFAPLILGFLIAFLVMLFSGINERFANRKLPLFVGLVAFTGLFTVFVSIFFKFSQVSGLDNLFKELDFIRSTQFAYSNAGIKGFDISTLGNAAKALPLLSVHFLLQPFPWKWLMGGESYMKLLIPDMIIWYVLLLFAFRGAYITVTQKNYLCIAFLGFIVAFLVINALVAGNVGAIYRYRLQLQEFAFVLSAMGLWDYVKDVSFIKRIS